MQRHQSIIHIVQCVVNIYCYSSSYRHISVSMVYSDYGFGRLTTDGVNWLQINKSTLYHDHSTAKQHTPIN